jgi:hypothetical protein
MLGGARFALCGLWICSLMEVSVFNGGYMAIFIVFVLWQKLATRFWVLLVLYCQAGTHNPLCRCASGAPSQ